MDIESETCETQQSDVRHQMQCEQSMLLQQNQIETCPGSGHQPNHTFGLHMPMELPVQTAIPLPAPPSSSTTVAADVPQPPSAEIDIDSILLQQFSCLGTTDHDDLISQFQSLMNNQMNKDSARFFLEMSNWNLQTAVGCYLDFCNFQTLPSMKIVANTNPDQHTQSWRLLNDGTEDWPSGCYLMSPNQVKRVEIPVIRAGNTCDITADLVPNQPAIMWRLCTPNGWYFGDTIWMIPPGSTDTAADLAEQMSQLRTPSNTLSPENFPQVNVVITVNME